MELSQLQQSELFNIATSFQQGIDSDNFYKLATTFDEKVDFLRALRHMVNIDMLKKKDDLYFPSSCKKMNTTKISKAYFEDILKEEKVKLEPKDPSRHIIRFEGERRQDELPVEKERRTLSDRRLLSKKLNTKPTNNRGTLKRTTNKGVIAMALYNCRNERHITPIEIKKLVSMEQTSNIHAQLEEMVNKGYLDKIKINIRSHGFKWSNKFTYPFQDVQVADKSLVLLDFKDL